MSRAVLDAWGVPEFGSSPYPERREFKPGKADILIAEWLGRWSRHGSQLRALPARRFARRVLDLGDELACADEDVLTRRIAALRASLARSGLSRANTVEGFALVREICARRLGKRHYPCQLMGGYAMLHGRLAEMMTGEGKTLTAVLPAVVVALAGVPIHVVTVNPYLAKRDAESLAGVYASFGLSVGLVEPDIEPCQRTQAYACDVTYCVNKDLVFDYLRDRIAQKKEREAAGPAVARWLRGRSDAKDRRPALLRGLYFAIVDEADSVLVDEARTPLIISAELDDPHGRAMYEQALALASNLSANRHYRSHLKERSVELTESGRAAVAECFRGQEGLWSLARAREEWIERALSALHLFHLDRHYIIADGKIQIVDEYTGRVMPDRSWEQGLHQMIEVKEGVDLTRRRETISRITYQRFFRRYLRVAGMSGTVAEVAPEVRAVYGLDLLRIPPNRPVQRRNLGLKVFASSEFRWEAVLQSARVNAAAGRAVLIGTRSVEASECIAAKLRAAGLAHETLNARQDAEEAALIGRAGRSGQVTVATNMAGRGTDILLETSVRRAGGLHVILTEYHDASRIDRQLYGRAGRQGDPGSFEALVSLEDELFMAHAPRLVAWLRARHREDGFITGPFAHLLRRAAQGAAERQNARIRQHTVTTDDHMEQALAFAGRGE